MKTPAITLNSKTVASLTLPPGKTEKFFWDSALPGFGVRLRSSGDGRWIFQYDRDGQTRRMTLGALSALTPDKARKLAASFYADHKQGRDPSGEKRQAAHKAKADRRESVGALLAEYLPASQKRLRPRSYVEHARHLQKYAAALHRRPVTEVTRRDIAEVLRAVTANSGEITSNRVATSVATFFGWAMKEGLIDSNPAIGTNRHKEVTRDRVLSDAELSAVWGALDSESDFAGIIRLLILTGQRAGEISALQWREVVEDEIRLPSERTKNKRPHIVPLSAPALAILEAQRERRPGRDFVFGRREGAFTGLPKCQKELDARIEAATGSALPRWTPHDLRRTAATRMAELGVAPHVVEAILNHVSGHKSGVAGIYNRATYEPEKREALNKWAAHLMVITGDKTIGTPASPERTRIAR